MASKVSIANFAIFVELGLDQITALTEDSKAARIVNLLFDDTAKEVMNEGAWASATFRQLLAQDATAPSWEFNFRYILPADPLFLGLLKINELIPGDTVYKVESGFLLTDANPVSLLYKGFQTDTEQYGSFLTRAITLRLASKMCYGLTGNEKLKELLLLEYRDSVDHGLAVDGTQSSGDDITITNDLKEVRL